MAGKVLVTGTGGKTGRAVVSALLDRQADVRAWVKSEEKGEELKESGVEDIFVGDIEKLADYKRALVGVDSVYHICPNMHPREIEIGEIAIQAAQEEGISHFVYHSVLHPQTEKMPHHWNKLRVEEKIFEADFDYTILQCSAYMQNILGNKKEIEEQGVYNVPYPESTVLSMVDINDIAEVVAKVLLEPGHVGATYELVGSSPLSQNQVANILSEVLGQSIRAEQIPLKQVKEQFQEAGFDDYKRDTLISMFTYYSYFGLYGNSNVLTWLLGRKPNSFAEFVAREF